MNTSLAQLRKSQFARAFIVALAASAFSLFFFSPRLLVFTEEIPGTFEWTRGLNFLAQLEGLSPEMVEPALRHRLLPIAIAKLLHLNGYSAFAFGWLGVMALLVYVYFVIKFRCLSDRVAISGVFLMASTSAVITSFGWLGIFDCWWTLALLMVALDYRLWAVVTATFLAPWVDERFLIGMPIALLVRFLIFRLPRKDLLRVVIALAASLLPYFIWRLYSYALLPSDSSRMFLFSTGFLQWISMTPHGWWMAYRIGWVFITSWFFLSKRYLLTAVVATPVVLLSVITAADVSRSAMVAAPFLVAGIVVSWEYCPRLVERWSPYIALSNFLVPYIHVVHYKLQAVHILPWEIIRLIKKVLTSTQ